MILNTPFLYTNQYIKMDSLLLKGVKKRSIQNQLMNAYRRQSQKASFNSLNYLPIELAKAYHLDAFKRFDTMRDTFIELIFEVAVSKNEADFQLRMRSRPVEGVDKRELVTLCLLDGVVVDSKQILSISPYQVRTIEVFNELYFFGANVYDGIVSVHTRNGDFGGTKIDDQRLDIIPISRPNQDLIQVLYDSAQKAPFYHDLLYWNPVLHHQGGSIDVEFSSSETTGTFEIRLVGLDEKGNFLNQSNYFSVSN